MTPTLEERALAICRAVQKRGGRAFWVGGCVRDRLLGLPPKDLDLEVYGIAPEPLKALLDRFAPVKVVGEAFAVYKLTFPEGDVDVSLPRR